MPITPAGRQLACLEKSAAAMPFLKEVVQTGLTHPLAAGATALSVASGDSSVGESVGMSLGGMAGWLGAQRGASAAARRLSKASPAFSRAAKFLPGWLKPVGMLAAGLAGSLVPAEIGQRIGAKVPIYKRKPAGAPMAASGQLSQPSQMPAPGYYPQYYV